MKYNEEMMKMVGTLFLNLALDMPAGVGRQAERLVEAKIAELEELRERINAVSPSVKAPWRTTVTDAMVEAAHAGIRSWTGGNYNVLGDGSARAAIQAALEVMNE